MKAEHNIKMTGISPWGANAHTSNWHHLNNIRHWANISRTLARYWKCRSTVAKTQPGQHNILCHCWPLVTTVVRSSQKRYSDHIGTALAQLYRTDHSSRWQASLQIGFDISRLNCSASSQSQVKYLTFNILMNYPIFSRDSSSNTASKIGFSTWHFVIQEKDLSPSQIFTKMTRELKNKIF